MVTNTLTFDLFHKSNSIINTTYIEKFWVGLMDGDGSVQVNHWQQKYLQFRLVIKLKNCPENNQLFELITKHIGGSVRQSNEFILWIENFKSKIIQILKIFDQYPPLTRRLQAQIIFMKKCLVHQNIEVYLTTRSKKYEIINKDFLDLFHKSNSKPVENILEKLKRVYFPDYFPEWLSGFIEAEGCFCIRQNKNHSFSIGQKHEFDLLSGLQNYLRTSAKIRTIKSNFYLLETYNRASLLRIIAHCEKYPLLGQKQQSFLKFSSCIKKDYKK